MSTTQDIVAKLWGLCHVLRDDGITYHQYVTELTYLLFLKMLKETAQEDVLPAGYRWNDLTDLTDNAKKHEFYRSLLVHLGSHGPARVRAIFANAATALRQPKNLAKLIADIDELDWYDAKKEGLGDLYEGLLQKNADEKKSGAGQYFTPRPLIDCMVELVKPKAGERVQDPALGTGGFLIAADKYVKSKTDELFTLKEREQVFQRREAFYGMELVQDAHRLALMNAMLHGIEAEWVLGDHPFSRITDEHYWRGKIPRFPRGWTIAHRIDFPRSPTATNASSLEITAGSALMTSFEREEGWCWATHSARTGPRCRRPT